MCTPQTTEWTSIFEYVLHIAVALPSFVINLFIFYQTHLSRNQLRNSFYSIYGIYVIMTSLAFFLDFILIRALQYMTFLRCPLLSYLGGEGTSSYIFSVPYFLNFYSQYGAVCCFTLITINRLTAVVWIGKYKQIWKSIGFKFLVVLFVLPAVLAAQTFSRTFLLMTDIGLAISYDKWIPVKVSLVYSVVSMTGCVISAVCTMVTLFFLGKMGRQTKVTERSLCIVGIIMTIVFILQSAIQLAFANTAYNSPFYDTIAYAKFYVIDVGFIAPPWSLLIMSKEIRSRMYCGKSPEGEGSTIQVVRYLSSNE